MHDDIQKKLVSLPRLNLTRRQICDAELLLNGGFAPLTGFLSVDDYGRVVDEMRLADGTVWPMPVTLDVSDDVSVSEGEEIILCDRFGEPLAFFSVESKYRLDKMREAEAVYGTADTHHPGVHYLLNRMHKTYIGGTIAPIPGREVFGDAFAELRHSPAELKERFEKGGYKNVIGFQTRNPVHRAHFEIMKRAASEYGGHVLLHPAVGATKSGDIDSVSRVRAYQTVHEHYMSDFATLSLLPLAMRMAGPREALWHAIVRKNYGCTHFIVGRDHASPGKDAMGEHFYDAYDAQELAREYEDEIGISIIAPKEIAYVEEERGYLYADEVRHEEHTVRRISGTDFRRMLKEDEEIPEWFSFPEVVDVLKKYASEKMHTGFTVFLTGLPSTGKSTIARALTARLREIQNREITLLDGDIIRQHLSKGLGFSREDRNENIRRIGFVAGEVVRHGGIAVCAAIAPYTESRMANRRRIGELGAYVEVFVDTPPKVCEDRDVKGLYEKARAGKIIGFTGVDDPYEAPEDADVVVHTAETTPEVCVDDIIEYLVKKELISH